MYLQGNKIIIHFIPSWLMKPGTCCTREQLVICLRWTGEYLMSHEDFIGLYQTDASTIAAAIKDVPLRNLMEYSLCLISTLFIQNHSSSLHCMKIPHKMIVVYTSIRMPFARPMDACNGSLVQILLLANSSNVLQSASLLL